MVATALALILCGCASVIVPSAITPGAPGQAPRPSLDTDFVERIDGSTATIPMIRAALRLLRGTDDHMEFNTTPAAYDNLIDKSANVIFVTAPSQEHLEAARKAGVQLEVIPIVKDALVFLVNKDNPVTGLTGQQVQDIYTGKVNNWTNLGGDDTPIIAYQRQTNSGSQTLFLQLAMKNSEASSVSRQLVEWCLSPEAQRLFSATGYVPLDVAHITPPDSGYGYDGSTQENTTQSSGTGGPAGSKITQTARANPCDDCVVRYPDGTARVELPAFRLAEASANKWLSGLPAPATAEENYCYVEVVQDLLVVNVRVYGDPFTDHSAVFRLADGHRMALSDFFYDGVNYIDFINRNLLNEATNSALRLCLEVSDTWEVHCQGHRLAPFTGLPADTWKFSFIENSLVFSFAPGNPFLVHPWGSSTVPLGLPNDLSPYGFGWWRLEKVQVGDFIVEHVVSDYLQVNPHDVVVNQAIDDWVASLEGTGSIDTSWEPSPVAPWVVVRQVNSDGVVQRTVTFDWFTATRTS